MGLTAAPGNVAWDTAEAEAPALQWGPDLLVPARRSGPGSPGRPGAPDGIRRGGEKSGSRHQMTKPDSSGSGLPASHIVNHAVLSRFAFVYHERV